MENTCNGVLSFKVVDAACNLATTRSSPSVKCFHVNYTTIFKTTFLLNLWERVLPRLNQLYNTLMVRPIKRDNGNVTHNRQGINPFNIYDKKIMFCLEIVGFHLKCLFFHWITVITFKIIGTFQLCLSSSVYRTSMLYSLQV